MHNYYTSIKKFLYEFVICSNNFNAIKSVWKQYKDEFRHNRYPTLFVHIFKFSFENCPIHVHL